MLTDAVLADDVKDSTLEETEKTHETPQPQERSSWLKIKPGPPEYERRALSTRSLYFFVSVNG